MGCVPATFRTAFLDVVGPSPGRDGVREVVGLCHRIARAYLAHRVKRRRLDPSFFGMTLDDLAMDCIAGLFARDEAGQFVELSAYFDGTDVKRASDEDLFIMLRRLVVSAVSDRLFTAYRTEDRSLSLTLRNLKRALRHVEDVHLERRTGVRHVVIGECRQQKPMMPPDLLEARLTGLVRPQTPAPEAVRIVRQLFFHQTIYRRSYPLMALARVLRMVRRRAGEAGATVAAEPVVVDAMQAEAVQRLVEQTVQLTSARMRTSYVDCEKLGPATFRAYFKAIQTRLLYQYVLPGQDHLTNYKALRIYLHPLTRETYRSKHRSVFEYLSRMTEEQLLDTLRSEMDLAS